MHPLVRFVLAWALYLAAVALAHTALLPTEIGAVLTSVVGVFALWLVYRATSGAPMWSRVLSVAVCAGLGWMVLAGYGILYVCFFEFDCW